MSVLRFLKNHLGAFALVCALLVIQSFAELALPQMMSDIVDIGIGQQGIPSAVFAHVRAETLSQLEGNLEPDEVALVESFYTAANTSGIRSFEGDPAAKNAASELAQVLARAIAAHIGAADDALAPQRAIAFVRAEYEELGYDLEGIRRSYLVSTSVTMLSHCVVALAASVCLGFVASRTGAIIGRDTREELFDKVMRFSPAEVNRFSQASLITRCTNDVTQVSMSLMMLMRMVLLSPVMGVVAITKVIAQPSALGGIIVAAVLMLLGVMVAMFVLVVPKFELLQSLIDRVNLMSRQMLDGIMPIRAFGREAYEEARFDDASTDLVRVQLFTGHAMSLLRPLVMIILNAATVAIVWLGADLVGEGAMQVGDVMAYSAYAMQIVMSFMMLAMVAIFMPRATVAADRILEVLGCPLSITDPAEPVSPAPDGPRALLEFDDVSFRYADADSDVVSHVTCAVGPGEVLGIVGSTGSGKSTLVQLIPRLYDATGGAVRVDGVDVRRMSLADLRARIGYVPQAARLFSGTVASNVSFGAEQLDDAGLERTLAIAQAAEFVEKLPEREDEPVAQGGSNLSGGQRQRLSIARAIAADPEILVLDDAFSALDYATDAALRRALGREMQHTAVVVVAQRVATVMHADRILVLDGNAVAGLGSHAELLSSCEIYREIASSQLSPEELGMQSASVPFTVLEGGDA